MTATSQFDAYTPEAIKAAMLEELRVSGVQIDTREGSYANILMSVAAYQVFKLYSRFPELLGMVFPDATSGAYIDLAAQQIGMTREQGTKAHGTVDFTGRDGTLIPAGTALYAPDFALRFLTTEPCTIAGGTASAPIEAAEIGADYNLQPGRISALYLNVAGVATVTNPVATEGGTDDESDADFFARYHKRRTLPITSGNANHYNHWATEVAGVSYSACVPLWNGNGTVKVIIAGADRGPLDETIRAACAAHIEAERPIGATVTVHSVAYREINVSAQVTLRAGCTVEQVRADFTANLAAMFAELPFGAAADIPHSRFLACLLRCDGVEDYSSFTVNGGTGTVHIAEEDAPVPGTIQITA